MILSETAIKENRCFVIENIAFNVTASELRTGIEYCLLWTDYEFDCVQEIYIPYSYKIQSYLTKAYITLKCAECAEYLIKRLARHTFSDGRRLRTWLVTQERIF